MMASDLRRAVCEANQALVSHGLVTLTWGNVSGVDRARGLMAIKPSGVAYERLTPEQIVLVDLASGEVAEGTLRPSSDAPTHLRLYRAFPAIGGVTHAHSRFATMFAQARRELPCLGTTHADHFHGPVPVTRGLTAAEVAADYEAATGDVIVEALRGVDPLELPAALVAGHAPFVWGVTPFQSLENAVALEAVAELALGAWRLNPAAAPLEDYLLDKHYQRKHGPRAYYGQP